MATSTQELVRHDQQVQPYSDESRLFMPVMSIQVARERRQMVVDAIRDLMVEATKANNFEGDYGIIPGTKKRSLLQPGADKLNNLFGLVPTFEPLAEDYDWTGGRHGGEAFFYCKVKCILKRGDYVMGEGIGSANSWEEKYRWRKAERVCPKCGKENIRKSKAGGWYCWQKTDGCGATFREGDETIESQIIGNKPNPNIFDLVNTIEKIANKRAKVAATINATSAHEFFTQDVEDIAATDDAESHDHSADADMHRIDAGSQRQPQKPQQQTNGTPPEVMALWAEMERQRKSDPKYGPLETFGLLKDRIKDATRSTDLYYECLRDIGKVEKADEFNFSDQRQWVNAKSAAGSMLHSLLEMEVAHGN